MLPKVDRYKDIKVPEGKIAIIPWDNRLLEMPPYENNLAPTPQWVREANNGPGSIRRCAATMDYVSSGITIPSWTNFRFIKSETDENDWQFAADQYEEYEHAGVKSEPFTSQPFTFDQTGECPISRVRAVKTIGYPKLVNPFRIITAPGWSTLVLPALYEPSPHYTVLPGIVNTDYYHEANCVLNLLSNESFTISWGTPLMHLIPIERKKMNYTIDFYDESVFKYVVGRGFGSGALKPKTKLWSSARSYRAYKNKIDSEKNDEEKKERKWWKK